MQRERWLRLFVAADLDGAVLARVHDEISALATADADLRWSPTEHLHVTLKFLGDTEVARVPAIEDALRQVASRWQPIAWGLRGFGRFPARGRPRVLWIGIDGAAALIDLAEQIDQALGEVGLPRETRAFTPHLTIGRVRGPAGLDRLEPLIAERGPDFAVAMPALDVIRLYASELRREGALHWPLAEARLGDPRALRR